MNKPDISGYPEPTVSWHYLVGGLERAVQHNTNHRTSRQTDIHRLSGTADLATAVHTSLYLHCSEEPLLQ